MPRKRQPRGATAEAQGSSSTRWLQETSVVRTEPSEENAPNLELVDATVYNKDMTKLENALMVRTQGPYVIRGTLQVTSREDRRHLIMKVGSSTPIEIRQCEHYSVDADGGIWVRGKGAWYIISPSAAYRDIHDGMYEAAVLYHSLIEIYLNPAPKRHKKERSGSMQELAGVFFQYAITIGDGSTLEDVKNRCLKHIPFFNAHCPLDHDMNWETTGFWKWLQAEQKKQAKMKSLEARQSISAPTHSSYDAVSIKSSPSLSPSPPPPPPPKTLARRPAPSSERSSAHMPSSPPRSPTLAKSQKPPPDPTPSTKPVPRVASSTAPSDNGVFSDTESVSALFAALEGIYAEKVSKGNGLKASVVVNAFYFEYRFPTHNDGTKGSHRRPVEEVLHYYARPLLERLDKSKYGETELYQYLKDQAQKPFSHVVLDPSKFPWQLTPRKKMQKSTANVSNTPLHGQSSAVSAADAHSWPVTPRNGKGPSKNPGKKSTLRPVGRPAKRLRDDLDADSDADMSMAKRSHYFSDDREEGTEVDLGADSSDESGDSHDEMPPDEPIQILLQVERIPSSVPRGPDNTWTCDQSECDFVVRAADADECQRRIHDHFNAHEKQMSRLDLAVAESRGHMPINHLLDKIKELGARPADAADGVQPIKRKLLV